MKKLKFNDHHTSFIYDDYITRIEHLTKIISEDDRDEILMEFNSHIYESMQNRDYESELNALINTLDRLGKPEVVLPPLIADKKMKQAVRTFNPIHVAKALMLNISNGISYIIFSIIYLMLFSSIFLIITKLIYPKNTGIFIGENGYWALGFTSNIENTSEIAGWYFIPSVILVITLSYGLLVCLLKLKQVLKKKRT